MENEAHSRIKEALAGVDPRSIRGLVMRGADPKINPKERKEIAKELSMKLIEPNGLIEIFSLIDFDPTSQKISTHNRRFMAMAKIVSGVECLSLPYDEYCKKLLPQLIPLLLSEKQAYWSLAGCVIRALIEDERGHSKDKKTINRILLEDMNQFLTKKRTTDEMNSLKLNIQDGIIVIHRLAMLNITVINSTPYLFYILCHLNNTQSHLKKILIETLVAQISSLKVGPSCYYLDRVIFFHQNIYRSYQMKVLDDSIGIEFAESFEETKYEQYITIAETFVALTAKLDTDYQLELFFHLLSKLSSANESDEHGLCSLIVERMVDADVPDDNGMFNKILHNKERVFRLTSAILSKYFIDGEIFSPKEEFELQTFSMCLGMLSLLISAPLSSEESAIFNQQCLPILKKIKKADNKALNETQKSMLAKVRELLIIVESMAPFKNSDVNDTDDESCKRMKDYESIVKDLNDPLFPTRVHALVRIKQLIEARDAIVLEKFDYLLNVISANITEEDPYVFLYAINSLASMAIYKTDKVLPHLIAMYENSNETTQNRLNIGETLVKLTKQLGQMTPHYAQKLMLLFLNGCKSNDENMRVSSLSNIGEVSLQLKDSLGKYIVEILACIQPLMNTDTLQVKRGAILLLRLLLTGVDSRTLESESVQMELINIYRILKKANYTIIDDALNIQIHLALEEIDRIVREELFSSNSDAHRGSTNSLIKNIRVLSLNNN